MDTTDPDIVFNDRGECNHCTQFVEHILPELSQAENSIENHHLAERIRAAGKGKKYDCVIGISGGVDSCYTAYWASKHQLRALLVHLDNGWNTDIAVQNIRKVAQHLKFDFESVVLDWHEFREIQLAFLRSNLLDIELPTDLAIPAVLHKTAAKYQVKSILSGGNYASEGILPLSWGYHVMKDMKLYRHIVATYSSLKQHHIPVFGLKEEIYYKFVKKIKTYYPLNTLDYDKAQAEKILHQELTCDFKTGKHHESRYTAFWQSYIMPVKYNFDYRLATYSSLIVSGQLTREDALTKLQTSPFNPDAIEEEKKFICKKLGIELSEFESILNGPKLTYKDFPNNKKFIQLVHAVYNKLFH